MSTAVGASLLAHGLHYAMVLLGLWGLAALLLPHALGRLVASSHPADVHAARVSALRAAVASGAPGIPTGAPPAEHPTAPAVSALAVPLALVAGATAAGVHAAVAPAHLRESPTSGLFFVAVAVAQLAWAVAAQRPSPGLLRVGAVANAALIVLWVATRTVGLPLGLLPQPHPVGGWDLACVLAELIVVAACVRALRDGVPRRCPSWFDWHPAARAAVGLAAVSLVLLTITGAGS